MSCLWPRLPPNLLISVFEQKHPRMGMANMKQLFARGFINKGLCDESLRIWIISFWVRSRCYKTFADGNSKTIDFQLKFLMLWKDSCIASLLSLSIMSSFGFLTCYYWVVLGHPYRYKCEYYWVMFIQVDDLPFCYMCPANRIHIMRWNIIWTDIRIKSFAHDVNTSENFSNFYKKFHHLS